MSLELYRGQRLDTYELARESKIVITKTGHIRLNCSLSREIPQGFRFVQLYCDLEERLIIIKLVRQNASSSYKLTLSRKPHCEYYQVAAKGYLKWFGIEHKEKRSLLARYNDATRTIEANY